MCSNGKKGTNGKRVQMVKKGTNGKMGTNG
jgi:hypothetical protein